MIKSMSVMENIEEVLDILRKRHFQSDSRFEIRTSFILNEIIMRYKSPLEELMKDDISKIDRKHIKKPVSVNFRRESYQKIVNLAQLSNVSVAEILRRIIIHHLLYDTSQKGESTEENRDIMALKLKVAVLREDLEKILKQVIDIETQLNNLDHSPKQT